MSEVEIDDVGAALSIALLVRHPSIDLAGLSVALRTTPFRHWQVGMPCVGPKGDPLPGVWRDSAWTKVWRYGSGTDLAEALNGVIAACEAGRPIFYAVKQASGVAEIVCRWNGRIQQGSTIPTEALRQLTSLQLDLGFEVFPEGLGLLPGAANDDVAR